MANITYNTGSGQKPWYEEFTDPQYGMVSGMSNALFFGIIVGVLVVLAGIAALIYHSKRKKELEKELAEQNQHKTSDGNQVAPTGDIYEEMEGEIEKHEQQKQKLQKYLSFLLSKDPQGLMSVNQKRIVAARARQNNNWF